MESETSSNRTKDLGLATPTTNHRTLGNAIFPLQDFRDQPICIPPGLRAWRAAVEVAENPSQLSICIEQLQGSIAWDKSIMKVYCQVRESWYDVMTNV